MKIVLMLMCLLLAGAGGALAKEKAPVTDGPYRTYFSGGAIQRESNYRNAALDGAVTEFYENGKMKTLTNYSMGVRNGVAKTFYDTGVVKFSGIYKDGNLDGEVRNYDKDGALSKLEMYSKGVLNGASTTYYPTGAVKKEMFYQNAIIDGTMNEYYEDGSLKKQEEYRRGALRGMQEYEPKTNYITKKKEVRRKPKLPASEVKQPEKPAVTVTTSLDGAAANTTVNATATEAK